MKRLERSSAIIDPYLSKDSVSGGGLDRFSIKLRTIDRSIVDSDVYACVCVCYGNSF